MIALMWGAGALGFLAGIATAGLALFARAMHREGLPWKPRPREHAERFGLPEVTPPLAAFRALLCLVEAAAAAEAVAQQRRLADEGKYFWLRRGLYEGWDTGQYIWQDGQLVKKADHEARAAVTP